MKKKFPLGYWNCGGVATAIVAIATYFNDELFDWAAYIGGTTQTEHEEEAYDKVAQHGCKLDVHLATYLTRRRGYPFLTKETYRP